jgi:predicted Zn finger-like uncharacterized protein
MIIQCEQCRTKFKLDDGKVSDRGVKVRCAKCRHVFVVRKDAAEQVTLPEVMTPTLDTTPAFEVPDETTRMFVAPAAEPEVGSFDVEPAVAFDFGDAPVSDSSFDLGQTDASSGPGFDFGDVSFTTETPAAAPDTADFGEMTMVMPPKQVAEPVADLDFGLTATAQVAEPVIEDTSFDFGDAFAPSSVAPPDTQKVEFDFGDQRPVSTASAEDIDLGGFDFGEAPDSSSAVSTGIDNADFSDFASVPVAPKAAASDLGFSFDDAVPQGAESTAGGFDFSGMDFGTTGATPSDPVVKVDAFSLGEMDFSGDTAAVEVDGSATAAAGALFAPVEETVARQQVAATPDITFEAPASSDEAPPLAISSRRRQSSVASIVVGVVAVIMVCVLGYMGYTFLNDDPKAVSVLGTGGVPVEDGRITTQNIKAYFIPQSAAGELLVITGDAMNGYKKPRAALQIKGIVFNTNNQIIATKMAYAGNPLTTEQLTSMTAEKIEAAMNNQFGDSLSNLEVLPGKTIPFTIVIINPTKEGKDFGVEPVGSTVAASNK